MNTKEPTLACTEPSRFVGSIGSGSTVEVPMVVTAWASKISHHL